MDDFVWWKHGVLYQIYTRSFQDSNGDGIGDLPGITQRLDYLKWLGVTGVWLTPITPSPNKDWGYDVSDFKNVDPSFGTLKDFDELIAQANKRDIKIILDIVPNHTSIEHPWFQDARTSKNSKHRDWYVWADPKPDGSLPNNWKSIFGGPAWTLDEQTGQYYLHHFLPEQPDLNWWNPQVHEAFDDILKFWFDRGVAGFRIDVTHVIYKDKLLRDNPTPEEDPDERVRIWQGYRQRYDSNFPETHALLRHWREFADSYSPPRIYVGETHLNHPEVLAEYYGQNDELHLAFNFIMLDETAFEANALRKVVEQAERTIPAFAWPVWTNGNHDRSRFPTRWCGEDERKVRVALMMLLTLRGTPFLYYGDELGMPDTNVSADQRRDPVGARVGIDDGPEFADMPHNNRDRARTPMQWSDEPGAGFTQPEIEPWLPFGNLSSHNVATETEASHSVLALTRVLIKLRTQEIDLAQGAYKSLDAPEGVWAYQRGENTLVFLNMSEAEITLDGYSGSIQATTDLDRTGESVEQTLSLHPWEGVVLHLGE